jgi:hypothetical protein
VGGREVRSLWSATSRHTHNHFSTGMDVIQDHFCSDDARPISTFFATVKSTLATSSYVYVDLPPGIASSRRASSFDFSSPMDKSKRILDYVTGKKGPKSEYDKLIEGISSSKRKPLAPELGQLRAVKSVHERNIMKEAADISGRAHAKVYLFSIRLRIIVIDVSFRRCGSRKCCTINEDEDPYPKALSKLTLSTCVH